MPSWAVGAGGAGAPINYHGTVPQRRHLRREDADAPYNHCIKFRMLSVRRRMFEVPSSAHPPQLGAPPGLASSTPSAQPRL